MLKSMTGFAVQAGAADLADRTYTWNWDIRAVNAKGLDLRFRVPDWIEGLEAALKPMAAGVIGRGSVQIGLRINRTEAAEGLSVNKDQLAAVLAALAEVEAEASARGVTLAPVRSLDLLTQRGVWEAAPQEQGSKDLLAALKADFSDLLQAFDGMRRSEGRALDAVLRRQLDSISDLVVQSASAAEARKPRVAEILKSNLSKVLEGAVEADPDRVAQELALLAVKADVSEEIDRLEAHVTAARDLLAVEGPVGRKLDFLMQEFNREANTLCSKSGSAELTRIGLDLKAVIDQMREQVQNVE